MSNSEGDLLDGLVMSKYYNFAVQLGGRTQFGFHLLYLLDLNNDLKT